MTKKQDLQKEILEKVKPGMKPSDLKKLKRSKSADDIPASDWEKENKELKKELEQTNLALEELIKLKPNPPNQLLQDQLEEKQQEIEELRQQLEQTNAKLAETTVELDQSLEARYQSLKDWNKQQEIIKDLNRELNGTLDQASEELIAGDDKISSLRTKINQLKTAKERLEKDLDLAQRLNELKKFSLPSNPSFNYWPIIITGVLILTFLIRP